jgi:hypothetical protein
MAVLIEVFLSELNIHFSSMFLKTQVRVFLKPPRSDLAFANSAEDRRWGGVFRRIRFCGGSFSELREVVGQHFSANAQGLDQQGWQIYRHFSRFGKWS